MQAAAPVEFEEGQELFPRQDRGTAKYAGFHKHVPYCECLALHSVTVVPSRPRAAHHGQNSEIQILCHENVCTCSSAPSRTYTNLYTQTTYMP